MNKKNCVFPKVLLATTLLSLGFAGAAVASGSDEKGVVSATVPDESTIWQEPPSLINNEMELTAELTSPKGWLTFGSSTGVEAEIKVALTVVVDGEETQFEAIVAPDQASVTWTGKGEALKKDSRDAIRKLLAELEPMTDNPSLRPHENWAFRLVNLWSEMPLNFLLEKSRTVVDPRSLRATSDDFFAADSISDSLGPTKSGDFWPLNTVAATCASGCNQTGGDGITYLRGTCSTCGCALGTYSTKHDACVISTGLGHCYTSFSVSGGCVRSSNCRGRCGPGCGITGGGPYTKDCLEHDHCVGHDNASACCANDGKCGDEFFEAEDDFLFGVFNCRGC